MSGAYLNLLNYIMGQAILSLQSSLRTLSRQFTIFEENHTYKFKALLSNGSHIWWGLQWNNSRRNWLECGRTVLVLQVSWHWYIAKKTYSLLVKRFEKYLSIQTRFWGFFSYKVYIYIYTYIWFFIWNLYIACYVTVDIWLSKFLRAHYRLTLR